MARLDPVDDGRADGRRVYEYVTEQGVVVWSLTKLDTTISPATRLVMRDGRGVPLGAFLRKLRALARFLHG